MFNRTDRTSPDPGILPPGRHLMIDNRGYRWFPDSMHEAYQLTAAYGAEWVVPLPMAAYTRRPGAVAA